VTVEDVAAACRAMNLELGERLGKGSRATVFRAVGGSARAAPTSSSPPSWLAAPGQTVAVKALLGEIAADALEELTSEAALWTPLAHDGIVKVHHATLSPAPLLVLEACEGGTLFAAMRRGDPVDARALGLDVARALAALHAAGQAHRDIKSANVLLTRGPGPQGRLVAKLCDWGSAARLESSLPTRPAAPPWPSALFAPTTAAASWTPVGTLLWMAPEMLSPHVQGTAPPRGASGATADVYSFATLLWELLERRLPWVETVGVKRAEVVRVVVREKKRLPIAPWVHPDLQRLMRQCWEAEAARRPTMAQVVERLEAMTEWDTNGQLARVARGEVPLPQQPLPAGMQPRGGLGGAARAPSAAELEALTLSETRPVVDGEEEAATPAHAELAARMTAELGAAGGAGGGAQVLLSAVLPHAYAMEVSAASKAELDVLVRDMKVTEARCTQLEERRRFDPLAAMVFDGKRMELEELQRKVTRLRAEAAVKAWARVAALLSEASSGAAKEYAAARRLAEEARGGTKTRKGR